MTRNVLIAIALVAGGLTGLGVALLERGRAAPFEAATMFTTPRELPALDLVDHRGEPLSATALHGGWDVLFFGFTHCPDVCPTTLAQLDRAVDEIDARRRPRVWLVSVDPARDTPAVLADYVGHFDPDFGGVTGSDEAIAGLAAALGVAYGREPLGDTYTMSHSGALFLVDPLGRYAGVFNTPLDFAQVTSELDRLTR